MYKYILFWNYYFCRNKYDFFIESNIFIDYNSINKEVVMDSMDSMDKRIKFIRKHNKMTQKEFGEVLRLSQDQISLFERGLRLPKLDTIDLICLKFGVNYEWLQSGNGNVFDDPFKDLDAPEDLKELGRKIIDLPDKQYNKIIKMIEAFLND